MDYILSKGPKEDGDFFGKNGTLQQMSSVADSIAQYSSGFSSKASQRSGSIAGLASTVAKLMSLLSG